MNLRGPWVHRRVAPDFIGGLKERDPNKPRSARQRDGRVSGFNRTIDRRYDAVRAVNPIGVGGDGGYDSVRAFRRRGEKHQKQDRKEAFLHTMTHHLKTLLNIIIQGSKVSVFLSGSGQVCSADSIL